MNTVFEHVRGILATVLHTDASLITAASNIHELPNADSAAILESIVAIEDHFGIDFPDAIVLRLERVGEVADAVAEQLGGSTQLH